MADHRDLDELFSRRAFIAAGFGGAAFVGLSARLFQLQMLEGQRYKELASENSVKLELAPPRRGRILDRFGVPLAAHRQAGRITLVPERVGDLEATLSEIARHIDLPARRQASIIREAKRQREFVPILVASELTYEDFARMNIHAASLPGVAVEMAATRSYPRGRDFAHVLGYVARASERDLQRLTEGVAPQESQLVRRLFKHPDMRTGRNGIELYAEDWLRGEPGFHRLVTNAAGRVIEELPSDDVAPVAGRDLSVTIDAELQRFAIERFAGEAGAAVVVDIESGDILSFVSTPAFDPNDFVNGISQADYDLLTQSDRGPLYHKAYDGTYPPGSTFKMVTGYAGISEGVITPDTRVYCSGQYRFGSRTWACWKKGGHGSVNLHSALKGSCDTYFYEVAKRVGIEKLAEISKQFGFGQRWELGMTGGRSGVVPNDAWKRDRFGEQWYEGETLNIGIGQGYLNTSPIQLAVMTARIASNGRLFEPRMIGEGPQPANTGIPYDTELDSEILQYMKDGMYGVTSEAGGTALRSGDLGLGGPRLAGKTGTAQVRRISAAERAAGVRKNSELERRLRDHALFVAYAPADNPRYAISVVVEHGGGGSAVAAPVARDIIAHAIRTGSGRPAVYNQTASVGGRTPSSSGKGAL